MAESPTDAELGRLGTTMELLTDRTRLRILVQLGRGPMSIGQIATIFGFTKQNVGHHLSLMRAAGLLVPERQGKNVYYRIDPGVAKALLGDMRRILMPGR